MSFDRAQVEAVRTSREVAKVRLPSAANGRLARPFPRGPPKKQRGWCGESAWRSRGSPKARRAFNEGAPRHVRHHARRCVDSQFEGVSLTLEPGELVVLTGVSGAGKSSLAMDTLYALSVNPLLPSRFSKTESETHLIAVEFRRIQSSVVGACNCARRALFSGPRSRAWTQARSELSSPQGAAGAPMGSTR